MPRTKSSQKSHVPDPDAFGHGWLMLAWLASAATWTFTTASLISFNPADPPSHMVWPHNDPVANWCGPVGAMLAYWAIRLLGFGVWVVMLTALGALALAAGKRPVSHIGVRGLGVLMLAIAVSGLQALLFSGSGLLSNLSGGLVGTVGAAELAARFSTLGSFMWLVLLGGLGAVVAFDRWVMILGTWIWSQFVPAATAAGTKAGSATGNAARATGGLVGALGSMLRNRKPIRMRLDDLEDDQRLARASRTGQVIRKSVKKVIIEDTVGGLGAAKAFDTNEVSAEIKPTKKAKPVQEPEVEPEGEDLPGAPQVLDEDRLREKVARLPIRFSKDDRRVATDADLRDLQGVAELEGYKFPGLDLLEEPEENFTERLEEVVRDQARALEGALRQYRINGEVVGIESGPVITLYHVMLAPGTKVAQINSVASDIARSLKAVNIRVVSNMVGRETIGIEVPNPTKEKVRLKELMSNADAFADMTLPMFLGKDASGDPLIADLTKMPHMLIAGTTGSGKSVCMNTIIMGFLYTKKPNELKLVLVDPKMVEMSQFKDIPHLMCPVVTEMTKAAAILEWAVNKMDERYELLAEAGCRDIAGYNGLDWEELKERMDPKSPEEEARIPRKLPYMVFIIDELADMMMTTKEVEGSIVRLAQKARAVGIHLILATQRPQANVVTGLIKSNMPCRVSFKVSSGMDSRIVLDQKGGELLLGQGDMLYLSPHSHKLIRSQGTLVDDRETRKVVRFMRDVARPTFERQLIQLRKLDNDEERMLDSQNNSSASLAAAQEDPLFDRSVEIVLESKRGSVSLLQRRLAIGYTRASRLIDLMGIAGIISDHKGSVARDVLITETDWEAMKRLAEQGETGAEDEAAQGMLFETEEAPEAESDFTEMEDELDETEVDEAEAELDEDEADEDTEEYEYVDEGDDYVDEVEEPEATEEEEEEEEEVEEVDELDEDEDPEAEDEYEEEGEEEDAEVEGEYEEDEYEEEEEGEYEEEDEYEDADDAPEEDEAKNASKPQKTRFST